VRSLAMGLFGVGHPKLVPHFMRNKLVIKNSSEATIARRGPVTEKWGRGDSPHPSQS